MCLPRLQGPRGKRKEGQQDGTWPCPWMCVLGVSVGPGGGEQLRVPILSFHWSSVSISVPPAFAPSCGLPPLLLHLPRSFVLVRVLHPEFSFQRAMGCHDLVLHVGIHPQVASQIDTHMPGPVSPSGGRSLVQGTRSEGQSRALTGAGPGCPASAEPQHPSQWGLPHTVQENSLQASRACLGLPSQTLMPSSRGSLSHRLPVQGLGEECVACPGQWRRKLRESSNTTHWLTLWEVAARVRWPFVSP